ncbi:MAG: DNA alkylation repair protein [Planctomycetes bacterium]|nr:DNA alkylation repair protein [Planctomycetota bacterium]
MEFAQVMTDLESFGSAQTRKTYTRHGSVGPMFGVKFGDLNKLVKKIKVDHDLAFELWNSGNFDARLLATMVADPARMTLKSLTTWQKDVDCHALSAALSNLAQRSPVAQKLVAKWMSARSEWAAATAWMMVAGICRELPATFTKTEYRAFLKTIEKEIHGAKNRVRYSMNAALIGIGSYIDEKSALAAAGRIGVVDVDHGDTSCKTPSAVPYIKKAAARLRSKLG